MERNLEGGPRVQEGEIKPPGWTVIEIGSGRHPSLFLKEENITEYQNAHLIYTDISEKQIEKKQAEVAQQRDAVGEKFHGTVDFVHCDGTELPFQDSSADEVYCENVFGDPEAANKGDITKVSIVYEAARVLKKGGEFVVAEWATPADAFAVGNIPSVLSMKKSVSEWERKLREMANHWSHLGIRLKALEVLPYLPENDLTHGDVETKAENRKSYLAQFPYASRVGGIMIPRTPKNRTFMMVLEKI